MTDPTGPNNSIGRAPSVYAHSDLGAGQGVLGPSPVGSLLSPPYGWDVVGEGPFHWLDYAYLPYLLTGDPYYLENEYQSAAFQPNFSSGFNSIFSLYNGHYIIRWLPWGMQSASRAAFMAPDGSADQSYWNSVVNSNIEFVEGALGITSTSLTPSTSQGSFATSGTITNFNVHTANRWDMGRYNEASGTACATTGSGSCPIISPGLHQWTQGFCDPTYPAIDGTKASSVLQYWMYWYNNMVFGEMRDMGFSQAAGIQNQMGQFLEGMVLSPTNNPWYGVASYETPATKGAASGCTAGIGQNFAFYTRYGGSTGIFGSWLAAYGNPTTTTQQGNFSFSPPSGGITTGNFPCTDHSYSGLARAAGTFLPGYGVNETDADGTYTPILTWAWLNTNVPFFGNPPASALPSDCPISADYDVMIKIALAPRGTTVTPPAPNPNIIGLTFQVPSGDSVFLSPADANNATSGTNFSLPLTQNNYAVTVLAPVVPPPMPTLALNIVAPDIVQAGKQQAFIAVCTPSPCSGVTYGANGGAINSGTGVWTAPTTTGAYAITASVNGLSASFPVTVVTSSTAVASFRGSGSCKYNESFNIPSSRSITQTCTWTLSSSGSYTSSGCSCN